MWPFLCSAFQSSGRRLGPAQGAAGSLFVCETLEISGDLWELDPRLRRGLLSSMDQDICAEVPTTLQGVCRMDYNEWGFCSREPSHSWAAFQWPQSTATSPQNNGWTSTLLYQALTPGREWTLRVGSREGSVGSGLTVVETLRKSDRGGIN